MARGGPRRRRGAARCCQKLLAARAPAEQLHHRTRLRCCRRCSHGLPGPSGGARALGGSRGRRPRRLTLLPGCPSIAKSQVSRAQHPHTPARLELLHQPTRASPAVGLLTVHRAPRRVSGCRWARRRSSTPTSARGGPPRRRAADRSPLAAPTTRRPPQAPCQAARWLGAAAASCGRLRAPLAAGPPYRARPRPVRSVAVAWPHGLGGKARRRAVHLGSRDEAHAPGKVAWEP